MRSLGTRKLSHSCLKAPQAAANEGKDMIIPEMISYERSLHYIGEEVTLKKNVIDDEGKKATAKERFRVIDIHRWHMVLTNDRYQRSIKFVDIILEKLRGFRDFE